MLQSFDRELRIGHSEHGIDFARVDLHRVVVVRTRRSAEAADVSDIKFLRLPGLETLFDLLRKAVRVGGSAEGFLGENRGRLMMSMPVPISPRETRNQDIRPKLANNAHNVGKWYIVSAPLLECFFRRL